MTFFTKESATFWRGLAKNNTKEWFDEHRKDYETHLKAPYHQLAEALVEQVREVEPEYEVSAKQAKYRINRDIRFSKDKTPYKTTLGITVGRTQKHDWSYPAYTVSIGVNGLSVGGGMYMPEPEMRDKIRLYVGENAGELAKIEAKGTKFAKTYGQLQGDAHKRTPPELKEFAEIEPRVRNKQWVFWCEVKDKKLFTDPKLDQIILDYWEAARPAQDFLKAAAKY